MGIEDWFDAVVISGELGLVKPDSEIFKLALAELGVGREAPSPHLEINSLSALTERLHQSH